MNISTDILLHETANSYLYVQDEPGFPAPVVVKILKAEFPSPQRIIQFNNEFEFTKNLSLPGIRKAFGSQKRDGKHTLLLEYVVGETLRDAFLRRRQPLAPPTPPKGGEMQQPHDVFLKTAIAIAEALRQVHEQGIIHKDINPNNILVDLPTGKVTIIDFGISTKIDLKTQHLGNPDKLEGTLAYLSPEQSGRMNRITDYRTDFYSLGVTFYELLSGKLPFDTQDSLELVHCHIAKTPPPVHQINPSVPPVLSDIVAKLMAKNAEDRYQSAFGLKADLERCISAWQAAASLAPLQSLSRQVG
ncbi:MAG: serine/threonine-protein kinase, partial [Bacteroidota bacterium]